MTERSERSKALAIRLNRGLHWLSVRWLEVMLVFLGIFVTLPFAAPTLMHLGLERPAGTIYFLYKPFCHQFGFRSFFLFGEQSVYPRANTGTDLIPYEEMIARTSPPEFANVADLYAESGDTRDELQSWANMQWAARSFVGNETMGYKVTVCARDIAIYLALWTGGLLYLIFRRRVRPVPLWLWFFLGIGPIGIDGFSQLLSYPPFEFWETRETLPYFRVLTGATFGFMNAWLGFPYLDLSFKDTQREIEAKFRKAGLDL
ncbi:MAG: DUF2085 domain-containing protein [Chloroflexota bacterium]